MTAWQSAQYQRVAADRVRGAVQSLLDEYASGAWRPSAEERELAENLARGSFSGG
ncbi:hypothetical protein ABZ419_19050 [Streptomyces cinnamoneus]|uniref:hypothetical protein n=1 Tax=Streptomyces cinnamoneus TaxID=53446 RepID=UPI0033D33184